MKCVAAVLALATLALASEDAYNSHPGPSHADIYNEKTRFVVSPNFPYDYNGYPFNKAHAAVYQNIPAYQGAYQQPHAQPVHHQQQQPAYQGQAYSSYEAQPAPKPAYQDTYEQRPHKGMQYHGIFNDQCISDGLYYRDLNSFVICSNNNPSTQACAPGSRNPDQASFKYGDFYTRSDFCSINLVDLGYAAGGHQQY